MMKIISRIMLLWIIALPSCASSLTQLPSLVNRSLRIDVDGPEGFHYQHETCTGYLFWKKCKIVNTKTDFCGSREVRQQLKDIGFKLKVTR